MEEEDVILSPVITPDPLPLANVTPALNFPGTSLINSLYYLPYAVEINLLVDPHFSLSC